MINKLFLLFFIVIICSFTKSEKKKVFAQINEECVFDTITQNDDFLKGIKELKDYSWNSKTKKAYVTINNNEIIEIYRGGCNNFLFEAKFKISKTTNFSKNEAYLLSKIIWISNLIYDKTDVNIIKKCLVNKKYSVDKTDPKLIHINLMDPKVYNLYTIFYNSENSNYNTLSIGYFLN